MTRSLRARLSISAYFCSSMSFLRVFLPAFWIASSPVRPVTFGPLLAVVSGAAATGVSPGVAVSSPSAASSAATACSAASSSSARLRSWYSCFLSCLLVSCFDGYSASLVALICLSYLTCCSALAAERLAFSAASLCYSSRSPCSIMASSSYRIFSMAARRSCLSLFTASSAWRSASRAARSRAFSSCTFCSSCSLKTCSS